LKLAPSLTVAMQENRVLTNTGRPSDAMVTSWASTSPVIQATCGENTASCSPWAPPLGTTLSKRRSWYWVASMSERASGLMPSPMQRAKVRSNTARRPPALSPTRNSLPAW
jgi:hypothetical protein